MTIRPEDDAFTRHFEEAMRPAVDCVLADHVRPWKRAVFWLALTCGVMTILSILLWVTT